MSSQNPSSPVVAFVGGEAGSWVIGRIEVLADEPIGQAKRLDIKRGDFEGRHNSSSWELRGAISHARYTTQEESQKLNAKQPALGRAEATFAALIPIRKSPAW